MTNSRLRDESNSENKQQSKSVTTTAKRARQGLSSESPKPPVVIDLVGDDEDDEPTRNKGSDCNSPRTHLEMPGPQAELAKVVDVDFHRHHSASQQHIKRVPSDDMGENAAAIMNDLDTTSKSVQQQTRPIVQHRNPKSNVELCWQNSSLPPNLNEEQQADWLDCFLAGLNLKLDFCTMGAKFASQQDIPLATCYTSEELLSRMDGQVSEEAKAAGWSVRALVVQFTQSDEVHVTRSDCAEYRRLVRKMARLGKNVSVATRIDWQVV